MASRWRHRFLGALLAVNTPCLLALRVQSPPGLASEESLGDEDGSETKRSPYDFRESEIWSAGGFEEKWEMLRTAVPLDMLQSQYDPEIDQGPQCQPGLYGPRESDKLAILQHGFLSCPGYWYRVVPRLVAEGFQVMLPVLPGHGRKYIQENGTIVDLGAAMEESEGNSPSKHKHKGSVKDDLSQMPLDKEEYVIFAKSLGQLAAQFKKDHPGGIVAVAGHSMGGAVTIQYAQEYADFIDRVIVLNPMLGLASGMFGIGMALTPQMRLSKGAKCENSREVSSGGTCQFRLKHVKAMAAFGKGLLCNQFGIPKDCGIPFNKLDEVKDFQVVSSWGETSVDNTMVSDFVRAVQHKRAPKRHGKVSKINADYCLWPSELGHSYLSNRPTKKGKSDEKWWHPYVEGAVVDFLVSGKNIDIVNVDESGNSCLVQPEDVERESLTVLPAIRHREAYSIGYRDPNFGSFVFELNVIFSGNVEKESHFWGRMQTRHLEIVSAGGLYLLVTRFKENDNIRNIYLTRMKKLVQVKHSSSSKMGILCARPELDFVDVDRPLAELIKKVEEGIDVGLKPQKLRICGNAFVNKLCHHLGCTGAASSHPSIFAKQ